MSYDRRIHIAIVATSCAALLLNIISLAGAKWATVHVYTSGIFLACGNAIIATFCTGEFVFPLHAVFQYAFSTAWFYVVRVLLVLSVFLTIAGLILSFQRKSHIHLIACFSCFLCAGSFILISDILYYNHTAFVTSIIGHDFFISLASGLLTFGCGVPYMIDYLRSNYKAYKSESEESYTD